MKLKLFGIDFELSPRAKRVLAAIAAPALLLGGGAIAYANVPKTWKGGDPLKAADLNGNFSALDQNFKDLDGRVGTLEKAPPPSLPQVYMYAGSLATPTEWEADVIFNKNYGRFCEAIGKSYVSATPLVNHYKSAQTNGYFYKDWYYAGPRFCPSDLYYAGDQDPANAYSVWIYNGGCGCCQESGNWTFETRALITCQ